MIIIYASKLAISRYLIESFKTHGIYKNEKIVFLHSLYFTNIKHHFPHNLNFSNLPQSFHPEFKFNSIEYWKPLVFDNYELIQEDINFSILDTAEKIIFCGDPSYFDVYYFSLFVEKFKIAEDKIFTPDRIMNLNSIDIGSYFKNEHPFFVYFSHEINYGKIRDYFNYQFNLHSLAIFGAILKRFDIDNQKHFISKYMLQLLYYFHSNKNLFLTEGQTIHAMHKWTGTGKYPSHSSIKLGSSASCCSIIDNLLNIGFLSKNNKLYLTSQGEEFLQFLPKDSKDLDLPFRLDQWALMDFELAKQKIDYYIYHYFRKLKNKLSK